MFTRENFFAIPSSPSVEPVETPAGTAHVRTLTVGEKDAFDKAVQADPAVSFRARLIVLTVCDDRGTLLFKPSDLHRIADYPVHLVEPLVDAAIRVNRLNPKDVEELEKNSASRGGDSSID